jgi:putative ABC transport system permease protein
VIPDWPGAFIPVWALALSFGFASLIGAVFGIYPAYRAACLDPIESLRYE